MQSEISLLLQCAAGDDSAEGAAALRQVACEVADWQEFIELALRHALVAVVAQELALAASDIVPASVLAELRARSQQGVVRSLQLSGELVDGVHAMSAFARPQAPAFDQAAGHLPRRVVRFRKAQPPVPVDEERLVAVARAEFREIGIQRRRGVGEGGEAQPAGFGLADLERAAGRGQPRELGGKNRVELARHCTPRRPRDHFRSLARYATSAAPRTVGAAALPGTR